jgi:peptide/nickel transport system permease protein
MLGTEIKEMRRWWKERAPRRFVSLGKIPRLRSAVLPPARDTPHRRGVLGILLREPASLLGLGLVLAALAGALLAPWLAPYDPTAVDLERRLQGPSGLHPLGTDHLGRDELSRLLHGGRTTLGAALVVLAAVMGIALAVGAVSGYWGGWLDSLLMALVDLLLAFPGLVLAVAIAGTLGPSFLNLLAALAAVWWAGYARLVRGMVLAARQREYVEAARAMGAGPLRIMVTHIWPNIMGPVAVLATLDLGWIILGISGLSFLGLGAQPPTPEWGAMLNDARPFLQSSPRLLLAPGAAIVLAVLGFNLLGDGLRDLLDPRLRRR